MGFEQKVNTFEIRTSIQLKQILEELQRMTSLFDQLSTEIQDAIDEISILVGQVQNIANGTSDAQVQPVLDKLKAAVTAAKTAVATPAPTPVPTVTPVPASVTPVTPAVTP
jgi:phage-related protein